MKKIIVFLCCFAIALSMVGCQSTNDVKTDVSKEIGIDLNAVLDDAYNDMNEGVDEYDTHLKFDKNDILNQTITYDEENDEYNVIVTITDGLAGDYATRFENFANRRESALSKFLHYYEFSLIEYAEENNIVENIILTVLSESGEYNNSGTKVVYKFD